MSTESTDIKVLKIGSSVLAVREDLSDRDRLFVPTWDDEYEPDEMTMESLALSVAMDLPALLVGPTGSGKTSVIKALAAALEQPLRRINMHGDVRSSDAVGQMTLEIDPDTKQSVVMWLDGVLPDAMRNGHWILLDELDACPASILMIIQAVLEPGHQLVLAANHGEVVEPHPSFRIFATANTLGRGDESGLYAGTNILNEATLDRFLVLKVDYMPLDKEIEVLLKRAASIPKHFATKMVQAARMIRDGFNKPAPECSSTFSTRRLVAWAQIAMQFAGKGVLVNGHLERAYKLAVSNKLSKEDAAYFAGVVQRVVSLDVRDR